MTKDPAAFTRLSSGRGSTPVVMARSGCSCRWRPGAVAGLDAPVLPGLGD